MNVLKEIHSEGGKWSSKRVYGGLLIIVVCVLAILEKSPTILETMLYIGAGLIGFGTISKIATAVKGGKNESQ